MLKLKSSFKIKKTIYFKWSNSCPAFMSKTVRTISVTNALDKTRCTTFDYHTMNLWAVSSLIQGNIARFFSRRIVACKRAAEFQKMLYGQIKKNQRRRIKRCCRIFGEITTSKGLLTSSGTISIYIYIYIEVWY